MFAIGLEPEPFWLWGRTTDSGEPMRGPGPNGKIREAREGKKEEKKKRDQERDNEENSQKVRRGVEKILVGVQQLDNPPAQSFVLLSLVTSETAMLLSNNVLRRSTMVFYSHTACTSSAQAKEKGGGYPRAAIGAPNPRSFVHEQKRCESGEGLHAKYSVHVLRNVERRSLR